MGTYWLVLLCLFSVFLCALKGFIFFGSFRHIFYLSFSVFRVRGSLFFACELELSFFIIYLTLPNSNHRNIFQRGFNYSCIYIHKRAEKCNDASHRSALWLLFLDIYIPVFIIYLASTRVSTERLFYRHPWPG